MTIDYVSVFRSIGADPTLDTAPDPDFPRIFSASVRGGYGSHYFDEEPTTAQLEAARNNFIYIFQGAVPVLLRGFWDAPHYILRSLMAGNEREHVYRAGWASLTWEEGPRPVSSVGRNGRSYRIDYDTRELVEVS